MSSRPVCTFPFDLITLNHFAHIFNFFSWLFNLLYLTCVMVNKTVKKKKKKRKKKKLNLNSHIGILKTLIRNGLQGLFFPLNKQVRDYSVFIKGMYNVLN